MARNEGGNSEGYGGHVFSLMVGKVEINRSMAKKHSGELDIR